MYELLDNINPCAAEVFVSIFHSFEAGIANTISSFKEMKNNSIYEKYTSPKLDYSIHCASTTRYVTHSSGTLFSLYMVLATLGEAHHRDCMVR